MKFYCDLSDPAQIGLQRRLEHIQLRTLHVDLHQIDPAEPGAYQKGMQIHYLHFFLIHRLIILSGAHQARASAPIDSKRCIAILLTESNPKQLEPRGPIDCRVQTRQGFGGVHHTSTPPYHLVRKLALVRPQIDDN